MDLDKILYVTDILTTLQLNTTQYNQLYTVEIDFKKKYRISPE